MSDLHEKLSESLYAILLREADWPQFLGLLVQDLGNGGAQFMLQGDSVAGNFGRVEISSGVAQKQIDDYANYFSQRNPWLTDHVLRRSSDVIVDHDILSREDLHRTEFYNDYLRPAGYNGSTGLILGRRSGETLFLVTIFADEAPEVATMVGHRLEALKPQLARMMRHYARIGAELHPGDVAAGALEVLGTGLCLINDEMKPALITPAAEAAAQRHGLFSVTPTGRIRLAHEGAQQVLTGMLSRGFDGPRDLVWVQNGCKLTLFRAARDPISDLLCGPMAGLIIERNHIVPGQDRVADLRQRFALTGAEARVLEGIAQGLSIRAMAATYERSAETIRSQVKSLLHKTGAANQLALLRLLTAQRA